MPDEIKLPNDVDKETKEILEEMKEDGLIEPNPEEKPKADEPKETPPKVEKPEVKSEEDSGKVEPEEPEDLPENTKRTPETVPLPKYMKMRDKVKELEVELGKIKDSPKTEEKKDEDIDKLVSSMSNELSEELGVDKTKFEGIFGKFASTIMSKSKPPAELLDVIKKVQEQEAWKKEQELFDKEFEGLVKDFPNEKINKDDLKKMAFRSDMADKGLFEIYFRHLKKEEQPNKKSAETSKRGVSKMEKQVDYGNLSTEEIVNLSDDEFDELSKNLEKGHSRLTIIDDRGNKVK